MENKKEPSGYDKLIFSHFEERMVNKSDMPLDSETILEKLIKDNPDKSYSKNITIKEIKEDAVVILVHYKDIK